MTTIRAYTTIEQSRKLAKILPPESADMHYFVADTLEKQEINYAIRCGTPIVKTDIPCWSLTALLGVLPEYHLSSPNPLGSMCCCRVNDIETYANNPVDACVAMIELLHEQKLL